MDHTPFVTIAMPCLNEEAYIEACVRCVQAQDYPRDRMEILIADGGSIDATREILHRLSADDPRIQVIDNRERIQAAGMNALIKRARGDVIVRMDVHAEYAPDYVRKCIEVLEATGADNVGGAQRARGKTWFQRAVCAALESPLAAGGANYRSPDKEGFVDTVFLGAYRRRVFRNVGLYDSSAVTNEDADINQRIVAAGGTVYLSRDIVVHYYPRDSFRSLFRQYFKYGQGRSRTFLKYGRFLAIRPAIPFAALLTEALLVATSPFHPFASWSLGAYALVTGAEAIRVGHVEGVGAIPIVWAIFPVLHVAHGAGFAHGLVKYKLSPDWVTPERLDDDDAATSATTSSATVKTSSIAKPTEPVPSGGVG